VELGTGAQFLTNGSLLQRTINGGAFPKANITIDDVSRNPIKPSYINVKTASNPTARFGAAHRVAGQSVYGRAFFHERSAARDPVRRTLRHSHRREIPRRQRQRLTGQRRRGAERFCDLQRCGQRRESATTANCLPSRKPTAVTSSSCPPARTTIRQVPVAHYAQTKPTNPNAYGNVVVEIGQQKSGYDFGNLLVTAPGPRPGRGTDSGTSSTDNITRFNNAAADKKLQFVVSGVQAGALVSVLANGVKSGGDGRNGRDSDRGHRRAHDPDRRGSQHRGDPADQRRDGGQPPLR